MPRFLLILLALLWGPSFAIIKIGLHDLPPLGLAAGRVAIAALVLYGFMRLGGERLPRSIDFWKKFTIMGLLSNVIPFACLMHGEELAPSALAAIIIGFSPVVTVIVAHFFIEDEKFNARTVIGILLGFVGILLLFLPSLKGGIEGNDILIGLLAFSGMAIAQGFASVYGRVALRGYPRFVGPTAQLITSSLFLIPLSLITEWNKFRPVGLESLGALLWLAIIATAAAYIIYYRLLEVAGATYLSLVTFLLPPIGAIIGVLLLDEKLGWNAIAACGIILVGVGFVRNSELKSEG